MIYVASFRDGWYKVGFTTQDVWDRSRTFWVVKHPPALCGRLGLPDLDVVALFAGGLSDEQAIFASHPPCCGEFYHEETLPRATLLAAIGLPSLPVPPRPSDLTGTQERLPCCGAPGYTCFKCGLFFARACKLHQHLNDVHRPDSHPRCPCGKRVIPRNLKRHQASGSCRAALAPP